MYQNPFLTKPVGSRWLNISLILFWHLYASVRIKETRLLNYAYTVRGLTGSNCVLFQRTEAR